MGQELKSEGKRAETVFLFEFPLFGGEETCFVAEVLQHLKTSPPTNLFIFPPFFVKFSLNSSDFQHEKG